jgi:hypothetical protein
MEKFIDNLTKLELSKLIKENDYIKNFSSSNKKRDTSSLSYLIDKSLSQSECIRLGICMENLIQDLVLHPWKFKMEQK